MLSNTIMNNIHERENNWDITGLFEYSARHDKNEFNHYNKHQLTMEEILDVIPSIPFCIAKVIMVNSFEIDKLNNAFNYKENGHVFIISEKYVRYESKDEKTLCITSYDHVSEDVFMIDSLINDFNGMIKRYK